MALVLPTAQSAPTYPAQAVDDPTDLGALEAAFAGTGVLSGCSVTSAGGLGLTVAVGSIQSAGATVSVAGGSVSISAGSSTDRRDIVVVNGSGVASVIAGTPCAVAGWTSLTQGLPPIKPAVPGGSVLLAEVYVPNGAAVISASNLFDKRVIILAASTTVPQTGWVSKSADYTLAATDSGVCVTGTCTITLPATPYARFRYGVKNFASGVTVTVTTGGANRIDTGGVVNATSTTITVQGQSIDFALAPNGTDWIVA